MSQSWMKLQPFRPEEFIDPLIIACVSVKQEEFQAWTKIDFDLTEKLARTGAELSKSGRTLNASVVSQEHSAGLDRDMTTLYLVLILH